VSYTEQLIAQLREAGLVKTKHGPGGGYYLTRPADRITVADVVRVFDEPRTLDGRAFAPQALTQSEIAELFGTDLLWKALISYILLFLEGISLADIAPDTDGALPMHVGHDERAAGMSDTNLVTFIDGIERPRQAYRQRPAGTKGNGRRNSSKPHQG
jgi:Rrf2 family protein